MTIARLLTVLFPAAWLLVPGAVSAACPGEASYPNATVVVEGDLRFVFGTDAAVYDPAQPVAFYLGAENIGAEPDTIHNVALITPMDTWLVLPGACLSISQPCFDDALMWSPQGVFFFGADVIVPPGGCHEETFGWDGLVGGLAPPPGVYAAFGGYGDGGAPPVIHQPNGGGRVEITIIGVVPARDATWGSLKSRFGTD